MSSSAQVKIESSWKEALQEEFDQMYFKELTRFVKEEYLQTAIYPPSQEMFRAFELCPFNKVKVVILGQDPYHGEGQANGLSFAVHEGVKLPPSLQNIFKEIVTDIGVTPQQSGDLSRWARQGVLLLNATLTVRAGAPGSHQKKGWEEFTDAVIKKLSGEKTNLVFILWGNYAKKKGVVIDRDKHLIITSAHPSPFSAYSGFFGSRPFSQSNEYLKKQGLTEIDWR